MVHRGPGIHQNVKYWIKPNIENRIKSGEIKAFFRSKVVLIDETSVDDRYPGRRKNAQKRFCFRNDRLSPGL